MKKSDLKSGMVIEMASGDRAIVFKDTGSDDVVSGDRIWFPLDIYNEDLDLPSLGTDREEIVKIFQPKSNRAFADVDSCDLQLLWKKDTRTPAQKAGIEVGDLVYDRFKYVYEVARDTGEDVILVRVLKSREKPVGLIINKNIRFLTKLEL